MAFSGTTQKCKVCEKTVYLVDQFTADNKVYHRACFRCHHCKGTLKLSNFSSFEGVLYCKPHYDQLLKMTGNLTRSFEGAPRSIKGERANGHEVYANNRVSSIFVGTQEKCVLCKKTVYPIEKVGVDGQSYHKSCFKCVHGGCTISPSNYVAHESRIYCKHHHTQLFKAKGNFSKLETKIDDIIKGETKIDDIIKGETKTDDVVESEIKIDDVVKRPPENTVPVNQDDVVKRPPENTVPVNQEMMPENQDQVPANQVPDSSNDETA